jgi:hypothetical protein
MKSARLAAKASAALKEIATLHKCNQKLDREIKKSTNQP